MAEGSSSKRILRFGVFELDTHAGELFKHGIRIKIQDQPFQVLLMLLDRSGEVVTREELRQRLWTEQTFVDFDHSLNIAVNKLRDCLGDSAENPRFVETLPRRGYRFLVPVTLVKEEVVSLPDKPDKAARAVSRPSGQEMRAAASAEPARTEVSGDEPYFPEGRRAFPRGMAVLALLATVALAGWIWQTLHKPGAHTANKIMLAVLPLESLSNGPSEEYFISGLHDEMISQLGRMHSSRLGVIARTSVLQYANTRKSIQEIGRELNVDYVLEGTVRRSAGRIRITVQLIKVSDQTPMWSEQFERRVADVIAIQGDVARRVADSLALELLPDERAAMERAATGNMGAYEDYLRGRYNWNQRTEEGFLKAIVYFEDAARKDPQFALAYAGLADCYNLMGGYAFQPPAQAYPKAKAAAAKALDLDPNLAEAHAAMGFAQFYSDWDWARAEQSFQRALAANPNLASARQWYGEYLHAMGRLDEAETQFHRAIEVDPFSLALNDDQGWLLLSQKRNVAAIEQFRKARSLDPGWISGYTSLAFALARAGRTGEALGELEELRRSKGETTGYLETLGYVQGLAGKASDAQKSLRELSQRGRAVNISQYSLALIHLGLGEKEQALAALERGAEQRDPWMPWLKAHPEWDGLRAEPRFQTVLRKVGL